MRKSKLNRSFVLPERTSESVFLWYVRLKEKYAAERRDGPLMQQRLEAALRNASELEAKNVLLTTQIAELEARTRRMSSRFSDMASLLGLKSSSNDDKVLRS